MEAIPVPFPGCRTVGLSRFGDDGSMYVLAMTEGQVWRTRPPARGNVRRPCIWQRFASGLYHPIGLQIIDGGIFVAQKPELNELVDRDGDGVADQFRTICLGLGNCRPAGHEYTFGLAADRQKNLWIALNTGYFWTNPGLRQSRPLAQGSILQISYEAGPVWKWSPTAAVYPKRHLARGPNGDIFFTDNQGD